MNYWISAILMMYVTHNGDCNLQHVGYATDNEDHAMILTTDLDVYLTKVATYSDWTLMVDSDSTFYGIKSDINDKGLYITIDQLKYTGEMRINKNPLHRKKYYARKFRATKTWRMSSLPCGH